ncbi:MAG: tRNA preQ1(34) S-adenosylmethionine ribosyltransferase-isomerase QueA [Hyphomicrobiaceae bacterium]
MRTELFDFELPDTLIALKPVEPRDAARLLVVRPAAQLHGSAFQSTPVLEDRHVSALPALLTERDVLVVNDTKVIPAALTGERVRSGQSARIAFTLIKRLDAQRWRVLARPAKRLEIGDRIVIGNEGRVCLAGALAALVEAKGEAGAVDLAFSLTGAYLDQAIGELGAMPLPPYIASRRAPDDSDKTAYQTMFARHEGAVAAPTAALHFTQELLDKLSAAGVKHQQVTLHVGAGTFLPVKVDDTEAHVMHSEWGEVSAETAAALNAVKAQGGRIVAVGTTALRLLESAADETGRIQPFSGETAIFITPGYRFRAVDVLMTNFHLPRSTLFMLVAAFSGLDTMRLAYAHAIRSGYRFYSYGDASLLFRR